MTDTDKIEKMIQDKQLTAPRITPEDITDSIVKDAYYVFPGTQTTKIGRAHV